MKVIVALQKISALGWLVLALGVTGLLLACEAPGVRVRAPDAGDALPQGAESVAPLDVGGDGGGQGDGLVASDIADTPPDSLDDEGLVERAPEVEPLDPEVETLDELSEEADTPDPDADEAGEVDAAPGDQVEQADADEDVDGAGPTACAPDHDGVLDADEVQVAVGAAISYTVNAGGASVSVPDLAGVPCEAGLCWDLSAPQVTDEVVIDAVAALSEEAHWFAQDFADVDGAAVIPLDLHDGTLGVYLKTDEALYLVGMASEEPDVTSLRYEPAVPLVAFPLQKFKTYEVEAEAVGLYEGMYYPMLIGVHVVHRYQFVADGEGALTVPAGTFDVLRLSLSLTMEVRNAVGVPVHVERYRVIDFLAECLGLVARLRSTEGEMDPFFGVATEYKRLGF